MFHSHIFRQFFVKKNNDCHAFCKRKKYFISLCCSCLYTKKEAAYLKTASLKNHLIKSFVKTYGVTTGLLSSTHIEVPPFFHVLK
jgi:hypothetical protein